MKMIDLSHPMHAGMPVFPGIPPVEIRNDFTVEKDGFAEKHMVMYTHTGTHIDAPAHMLKDGLTLDLLPVDHFIGSATVLDARGLKVIDRAFLQAHEKALVNHDFLLFCTGWDQYWGDDSYFKGYPALDAQAAAWLVQYKFKGIGVDAISIDAADVEKYAVHHILLSKSMIVIENCRGLDRLIDQSFQFSCLPLALQDADGSPVRAVAVLS